MSTRLMLLICLSVAISSVHARNITITSGEFPPWTGEKLPEHGYVNHIISAAFAAVGIETSFVYMPWARAYREAVEGNYHATSFWYASAERESEMLFSEPLVYNRTVFFQRSSDKPIRWKTLEDLSPYRIAVAIGYTYTPEFHFAMNSKMLRGTLVSSDIQSLKMLLSNRVDLFVSDQIAGLYMAQSLGVDREMLRVVEPELIDVDGYLMASRQHPDSSELIEAFNRGLAIIKASGKYQRIVSAITDDGHPSISATNPGQRSHSAQ